MRPNDCCVKWALISLVTSLALFIVPQVQAEPVDGEIFPLPQPDGSVIQVRIWGDEFYRVIESIDGYTLTRDSNTGLACYARLSADGNELISTGVPVVQAMQAMPAPPRSLQKHLRIDPEAARAQALAARQQFMADNNDVDGWTMPDGAGSFAPPGTSAGNVVGICLLIDFSDDPGTISPTEVNNYCNQIGYTGYGNNGSVRDYYYDISNGLLTYTNFVPDHYYRSIHPKTYYTDPNQSGYARDLVLEALQALDDEGFDFSQYDSDGDGIVDGVNVYYAGNRNSSWGQGLWPHSGGATFYADGVRTSRYQITDMRDQLTLYTFCHENGHMICGWPDLYDYGFESHGIGHYCLMCLPDVSTRPQHPCAYLKYIVDWTATTLLTTPQTGLSLPEADANIFYKYENPNNEYEYYMISNRQKTGPDASLPDDGLAIWHIDVRGSNSYEDMTPERHYRVTLVQADGNWDMEHKHNRGDSTDLYAAPTDTECTPFTNPKTHWWDGSASALSITNISVSGTVMTFDFTDFMDCNNNGTNDSEDIANGTSFDCNANNMPDECEASNDMDLDDIIDDCDNCIDTPNTDQIDSDNDDIGDACDTCPNDPDNDADSDGVCGDIDTCPDTLPDTYVTLYGCPTPYADFDRDGDVDHEDFGQFQLCLSQPGSIPPGPVCASVDYDNDDDVDQNDLTIFLNCFSGAKVLADPTCDGQYVPPELRLVSAVSRKTHDTIGIYDINLPLSARSVGGSGIDNGKEAKHGLECRIDGPTQVIMNFTVPLKENIGTWNGAEVQLSAGTIDNLTVAGEQLIIDISGVPDQTCLAITLVGFTDQYDIPLVGDNDIHVRVLLGDVDNSGYVNIHDLSRVRNNLANGQQTIYSYDLNMDGYINIADLEVVKSNLFQSVLCE